MSCLKPTKVAYLDYSPHFAGAERALCTIISHLDKTKFEPIIVFPYPRTHHQMYEWLGCRIIYLCNDLKWWMGSDRWRKPVRGCDFLKRTIFGYKLAKVLHENNIGILHVNLLRPDSMMWIYASHLRGIKIIGHFRSLPISWVPRGYVQKCCDCIINVSNIVKQHIGITYKHSQSVVIYDSIPALKKPLNNRQRSKVLASVAALFPNKGHDNAIKAFARIAGYYPEYELHIVGGGASQEIERLENIAKEEGVYDRVRFTREQVKDVVSVYSDATLVLSLTKEGEAFGLVPFEAALCDTPAIAPNKGAVMELLQDGYSGILVETESIDAIAEKIKWALQNMAKCREICQRTKYIVQTRLTPEEMTRQIETIYAKLL